MIQVDPKRFQTPQIVERRVRPWVLFALLVTCAMVAVAWYAFQAGRHDAGYRADDNATRLDSLRARVAELEAERHELRLQVASLERQAQVDSAAAQAVQADIKSLHDDKAALNREVTFLKRLLSEGGSDFQVEEFELGQAEAANGYNFSFTVTRREKSSTAVKGEVLIRVSGQLKGKAAELDLKQLTGDKVSGMKMNFKHYQRFEGDIELPVGFIPKTVMVDVKPSSKKLKGISRPFDWKPHAG